MRSWKLILHILNICTPLKKAISADVGGAGVGVQYDTAEYDTSDDLNMIHMNMIPDKSLTSICAK